ncbi:MAG: alpha/beta hydrolase [Epsilonproteobacteria bacterium]|nr:alpha/beta hydrolase [Campylobacterota bacterium]
MALKEIKFKNEPLSLSYEILNLQHSKTILFLHGWGSNKEIMKMAFGSYLKDYRHLYLDLPGFGASKNEKLVLTTKDYKEIVELFLKRLGIRVDMVVGHSFGGKVATLLEPPCLILLSSAGIVLPKPFKVRLKIALFKLLKPFGGGKIRKFFVSQDAKDISLNMYETFKNVVDEDFRDKFASFKNRALIFWGKDDKATPLIAGKEINSLIKNSKFYLFDGDHYFFLDNKDKIAQIIEKECGRS